MRLSGSDLRHYYLSAVALIALLPLPASAEWYYETAEKMGTLITVQFWCDDPGAAPALTALAMSEMDRIENAMSTYISDTEISRVNASAADEPVVVSRELFDLLRKSLELSSFTGGAFDITYDSIGSQYDFRESVRPDEAAIQSSLSTIDYQLVELDESTLSVRFLRQGVRINLGGIAKGYAVERAVALLAEQGVTNASVTAGGDTRILGDRRGKPWVIGIRHPDRKDAVVTRLPLINEAISTSGDYERFFIEDGERYHHIINPESGKPTQGIRSATVLGPDGTMTDGLSTSVFVAGIEGGLAIIERLPGFETVIIDSSGQIHFSSGLQSQ